MLKVLGKFTSNWVFGVPQFSFTIPALSLQMMNPIQVKPAEQNEAKSGESAGRG